MKLKFEKNDASEVSVSLDIDTVVQDFDYIVMMKELIKSRNMEDPEILGGFSEAEAHSIKSMVKYLNDALSNEDEDSVEGAV